MAEIPDTATRNRFLLTSLAIIVIFILSLIVLLGAYPAIFAPGATLTPTITPTRTITPTITKTPTITLSPTPTRTRRPTFTPTITLTPPKTGTVEPSPTPIGPPTLTPARPVVGSNIYSLNPWTAERADAMVRLMDYYPKTLLRQERGDDDSNYYAAAEYAIIAQKEALLRYPDSEYAETWRWGLAYNLAQTGSPEAAQLYADLVLTGLNSAATEVEQLPVWFEQHEPRLFMLVSTIKAPPGFVSGTLIEIGGGGSAHLLVLKSLGAYQAFILNNAFDFVQAPTFAAFDADLTGDGLAEIVIYRTLPEEAWRQSPPLIYNLEEMPPHQLEINPSQAEYEIGVDFFNHWRIAVSGSTPRLEFASQVFPACPANIRRTFAWDGTGFNLVGQDFEALPNPSTLAYCQMLVDHAISVWGPNAAIKLMTDILPIWPPSVTTEGKPYPIEARDEWRYRIGLYQALAGDSATARMALDELVANPSNPGNQWASAAEAFLSAYQTENDLYPACLEAPLCNASLALQQWVESQPRQRYPEIVADLWATGVTLRVTDYFDFDGDDTKETWFTVRHRPGERLEFWALVAYPEGIRAFSLGLVDSDKPSLIYYEPDKDRLPPTIILEGKLAFRVERLPKSIYPYLTYPELPKFYPDRFQEGFEEARDELFDGLAPRQVLKKLLNLQDNPGLLCRGAWSCDDYYYILGLTYELANQRQDAIDTYVGLWWDYSRSPYTTMARLKLKGAAVIPSATPTPTTTGTLAATLTPTITGTPPTSTPTPTVTGTPDLNATATETPTETLEVTPTATEGTPYPFYLTPTSPYP